MARGGKEAKSRIARKANSRAVIPDVYNEMLTEAVSSPTRMSREGTPVKRRRVGGRIVVQEADDNASHRPEQSIGTQEQMGIDDLFEEPRPNVQLIEQTESEDSADSDEDFEDVDLGSSVNRPDISDHEMEESGELKLVLGDTQKIQRSTPVKQKPITPMEKKVRLEIHKMHLCSLLAHVCLRNYWCNDEGVHEALKSLLTKKMISYLNQDESKSQFQRSRSFMDGLTQASETFRAHFRITARGMSKPVWADSPEALALLQPPEDIDLPMQKIDFVAAASKLKGSRDVGAQLFCAMLRAAGVDARLVCSMLPLPFQAAKKIGLPQVSHNASRISHPGSRQADPGSDSEADIRSDGSLVEDGKVGSSRADIRSRLGVVNRDVSPETPSSRPPSTSKKTKRKPIRESKYPVYWVEAFNEAVQKWVPIDPLVTKTITKSSKFEPPAGDSANSMSYVVAFEDDGSARDVTRRYTKAYNAKTRRERVEVARDGAKWWRRVMKLYKRPHELDRDQVEDAELTAKEAAEPMPRNVQDFKDHPYYALERHLRRHEVIHPKREVGKVGAGRPGTTNALEPIYRRRDVQQLKSADKWYRMGREVKHGEQPLKRIAVHRTQESSLDPTSMDAGNDGVGAALYAPFQTTLYIAPSVVNGKIPKNVYGNLDVYVPSMVPMGGTHVKHPEAARAAKILGIDYADAVTGFSFKGRHGTAITNGAVVAVEYREAVVEVVRAIEDERARAEEDKRSLAALKMWKRFLTGLRIMERIEGYDIEGGRDVAMKHGMEQAEDEDEDKDEGGGFLIDRDTNDIAQPTARTEAKRNLSYEQDDGEGGGFIMSEDDNHEMKALQHSNGSLSRLYSDNEDDYDSAGFQLEENPRNISQEDKISTVHLPAQNNGQEVLDQGGGFLLDDQNADLIPAADSMKLSPLGGGMMESHESFDPHSAPDKEQYTEEALPDLPASELEEARVLQQLHESQGNKHLLSSADEVSRSSDSSPKREPTMGNERRASVRQLEEYFSSDPVAEEDSESSEDKGSLLSHDPDDEDADPEWLA